MLHYRYGCVGAAKSANLLMLDYDFRKKGNKTFLMKSEIDTRDSGIVRSRVGLQAGCFSFSKDDNLIDILKDISEDVIILIDEIQFCTADQIYQIIELSQNRLIYVYGLKSTYSGELFPCIAPLLVFADTIQEIETSCSFCQSKATLNLRMVNGKPVYDGDTVVVGDIVKCDDYYLAVCSKHYRNPKEL